MFENSAYNNILNKFHENKLAHAYLIETNNIDLAIKDLKTLLKILNCPNNYKKPCEQCNLCNLVDINNLPSIKIIEPEGTSIKKKDIQNLKDNFTSIPLYSKYNTYIIKNAEKLNISSANSMLKFIEEPTPGILGFFITNNKDIMIDTIKSRCEIYTIKYANKNLQESLNVSPEVYNNYLKFIPNFLDYIYSNQLLTNKEYIKEFPERIDIENILKIIHAIYYQYLLKYNTQKYDEEILKIYSLKDDLKEITKKLIIITKILTNMSYNVSIELILDNLVLEMRGSHE